MPLAEYVALARVASGDALAEGIHAFRSALLGADVSHPSASAVLSFGFGAEPRLLTELEFCAHCLYTDDVIAQAELERVFHASHLDATPYRNLARALGSRATRPGRPRVHSFVGIDAKAASPVYTIWRTALPGSTAHADPMGYGIPFGGPRRSQPPRRPSSCSMHSGTLGSRMYPTMGSGGARPAVRRSSAPDSTATSLAALLKAQRVLTGGRQPLGT